MFSKSKNTDVSVYARGKRLKELCENGLRYFDKGTVNVVEVRIIDAVKDDDIYDYIFASFPQRLIALDLQSHTRVNLVSDLCTVIP